MLKQSNLALWTIVVYSRSPLINNDQSLISPVDNDVEHWRAVNFEHNAMLEQTIYGRIIFSSCVLLLRFSTYELRMQILWSYLLVTET